MSTTYPPLWFNRLSASFPRLLGNFALVLALWLALVHLPSVPSTDLDPSWRMAMGYGAEHGWQFGSELIFTYGPLGYLLASTNSGGLFVQHLVWQFGANLIFALSIWYLGRSYHGWRKTVYYLYFFAFGLVYHDAVHMIVILLYSVALMKEEIAVRRWLAAILTFGIAVMALVKFTNLMLAGVGIGSVVAFYTWRR